MRRNKEQRTKKYMQDQRHKKRLERLAKSEACRYPAGAIWVDTILDENGERAPREKPFAMRTNKSRHSTRYSYFKNYSNRVIRRNNRAVVKGGAYKKEFDYKWAVD